MIMDWQKTGIDISKVRNGKTTCPKCSHTRRDKNDKCLSVNVEKGVYNCHHCEFQGTANTKPKKIYTIPPPRLEKLSAPTIEWFEKRGISNNTLLRFGITESMEFFGATKDKDGNEIGRGQRRCICYNFFRDEKVVYIKFRDRHKTFSSPSGNELILYNLDSLKNSKTATIVEGENDALASYESGIFDCVSVPNGANKGSQKLEYMDNCWESFEDKEKVVIMVDNDEAGESLKEELARRIGKERCYLVTYPEGCKDANEVLLKYGKAAVKAMHDEAKPYPLEGILTCDDFAENIMSYYINGFPEGQSIGESDFDEHLTFADGLLTMVTGIPFSGKDEVINHVAVKLAKRYGAKFGIAGFEEPAEITGTKLIEKFAGRSFAKMKGQNPYDRMSIEELEKGMIFLDEYFKFIDTDAVDITIDGILVKFGEMVRRYGINYILISPWNCFEHKRPNGMSETEYIGMSLQKIIRFIRMNNLHCFLIAHPIKISKNKEGEYEVPTLYNISGSANFFNMTHNGMTVYRNFDTGLTTIHFQKVKFWWLGKIGEIDRGFDVKTRQYKQVMSGQIMDEPF